MDVNTHLLKILAFIPLGVALQGCSDANSDDGVASADGDADLDVEFSGSVGDGPVVNAQLTVRAKSGEVLRDAIVAQNVHFASGHAVAYSKQQGCPIPNPRILIRSF